MFEFWWLEKKLQFTRTCVLLSDLYLKFVALASVTRQLSPSSWGRFPFPEETSYYIFSSRSKWRWFTDYFPKLHFRCWGWFFTFTALLLDEWFAWPSKASGPSIFTTWSCITNLYKMDNLIPFMKFGLTCSSK